MSYFLEIFLLNDLTFGYATTLTKARTLRRVLVIKSSMTVDTDVTYGKWVPIKDSFTVLAVPVTNNYLLLYNLLNNDHFIFCE